MKTYNELTLAQELIKFQTIKTEDKGIMNFLSRKLSSIGFKCHIIKSLTALIQHATLPFMS